MSGPDHPVAIIAAVADNGVIGRGNDIPWRIATDWAHFKALTLGHTLVMGRRTHHSIGRPLPGRRTIVVTSTALDGIDTAPNVTAAVAMAEGAVFLAGGAGIYRDGFALADTLHITRVHATPAGDTYFPPFEGFHLTARIPGERGAKDDHDVTFETWSRDGARA